jgi:undecaprenyl pyrophosphate phosphatase UppP
VAVWVLMRYVKAHRMTVFAVYTAIVGVIVVVLSVV